MLLIIMINQSVWLEDKKIPLKYKIINYEIAGLKLSGWQASKIRKKQVYFNNSFVIIRKNELFLNNVQFIDNNSSNIKLLFRKNKILRLIKMSKIKGMSIVFVQLLCIENFFKIKLAVVKGLKKYDIRYIERKKTLEKKIRKSKYSNGDVL